jgi:hypothetical protein
MRLQALRGCACGESPEAVLLEREIEGLQRQVDEKKALRAWQERVAAMDDLYDEYDRAGQELSSVRKEGERLITELRGVLEELNKLQGRSDNPYELLQTLIE